MTMYVSIAIMVDYVLLLHANTVDAYVPITIDCFSSIQTVVAAWVGLPIKTQAICENFLNILPQS